MESKDYRSSIKVVGTVLADTKVILKKYLELKDIELLRQEVLDNNLILKTSKRRAETIFYELRKRYLYDQLNGYKETPFIYLLKEIDSEIIINPILYYHLCKEERILYDYITNIVYNKYKDGYLGITSEDTRDFILHLAEKDESVSKWSERTIRDTRSAMIGVLKEFGFINSRKRPTFNKLFISSMVFYYILYMNKEDIKTVEDLYNCKDMHLFLLLESDINILIEEAYRNGILDFRSEQSKTLIYKYKNIKEIIDAYVNGEIQ